MTTFERIARNASILFIANVVTLFLGFISLSITGRYLGAELFGVLSLALAFFGMFGIISDLGLGTLTTRELARNKHLVHKYARNIIVMRVCLSLLVVVSIILVAGLLGYALQTIYVISLVAVSILFYSVTAMYNSIFQAFEKMKYQSIGSILYSALFLCGVIIAATLSVGILGFSSLYILVYGIVALYSWLIFRRKFGSAKPEIDLSFWQPTIKAALPFAFTTVFVTIYFWIDSVLLSVLKGLEVVGWYNAAYRLMTVLLVIPQILNIAVLPAMSQFYVEAKDSLLLTRNTYFRYIVLISVPMGISVTYLAEQIMPLIFGAGYEGSIVALQILVWSAVFIFLTAPFYRFLESSNKQLALTKIALICTVENIALNLALIPSLGLIAASLVTVLTELTTFLFVLYVSRAVTKQSVRRCLPAVGKTVIAASSMVILLLIFNTLNHALLTGVAICIYIVLLFITGLVGKTDVKLLAQTFHIGSYQK